MDYLMISTENKKEIESLVETLRIFTQDIEMKLGIEKYTVFI